MPNITKKQFKEILNAEDLNSKQLAKDSNGKGVRGNLKPRTRLYGDYLYAQDREMFNHNYHEYLKKMPNESKNLEYCNGALALKKELEESYLILGERLYNIKTKELYLPQWSSWEVFAMELKMSQNAINKMIQIYSKLVLEYQIPGSDIATAGGWTVIAEILPVIETKKDALEWLEKAQDLTREDLRREVTETKTGVQMKDCKHKDTYTIVVCRGCGIKMEDHKDH